MKRFLPSVALALTLAVATTVHAADAVTVSQDDRTFTLDNGIVKAIVAKESGDLVSLRYKGLEMLATITGPDGRPDLAKDPPGDNPNGLNRGMTDHQYFFWSHDAMGQRSTAAANPTVARVTIDPGSNGGTRAEVSVKGVANGRLMGTGPGAGGGNFMADVEIRFALGQGESGVYTYCTFEHQPSYAATAITEARCCAKLADFFDWMSIADDQFHNKHYPSTLREGDKYVYTTNQYNNPAFGWSSTTKNVGLFFINPSNEYMSGGPTKIEFLGHRDTNAVAAPCVLNYWRSSHYGGAEVAVAAGEHWTKVIGPFLIYVNSGADSQEMYKDARAQAAKEAAKWPYGWVEGVDYPVAARRATVKGQVALTDPLMPGAKMTNVMVGLTAPAYTSASRGLGGPGAPARTVDWQQDAKNYQFWVRASDDGTFEIPKVRPGTYTLHAFATGVLGEFAKTDVKVEEGKPLDLGKIAWTPVRRGKQLWEIGIPNRNGSEFFKGDVYYTPGIGATYATLFPNDIIYTVGRSDFTKDWFFQHVPHADPTITPPPPVARAGGVPGARGQGGAAGPTTRGAATTARGRGFGPPTVYGRATPYTVVFTVTDAPKGKATLRAAFAGTGARAIEVAVNDKPAGQIDRLVGDGVLSNHGSQGIWYERELAFDASLLKQGENTLKLTVPAGTTTAGVIYDYLRLELDENATVAAQ
jgi:rhamnogalacturonan endolyase